MREEKDAAAARKRQKEAAAAAKKAEAEAAARRPRSATGHLLESGPNPGRMGRNSPMLIVYDRDGQVCVLGRGGAAPEPSQAQCIPICVTLMSARLTSM